MGMRGAVAMMGMVSVLCVASSAEPTYAERLGWPPGTKAVIFHVDDAGMHHDANVGCIEAMEKGVATSASIMFPCAWVSEYVKYLKKNPGPDVGVHLTLTSEWENYRWGPVAGKKAVPGLVDQDGCLWDNGNLVKEKATVEEVDTEMRAQLDRCLTLGLTPTHLDTHMGVVFDRPEFTERYLKLGIEKHIPVLIAGGHMECLLKEEPGVADMARTAGKQVWDAGLPVLDDIHTPMYGWKPEEKKAKLIEYLKTMKPGVVQVIVHCAKPGPEFAIFTGSGPSREGDLNTLTDPEVRKVIEEQKIVLTTWRELMQRRATAK